MAFLLLLVLLGVLFALIVGGVTIFRLFHQMRQAADRFKQQMNEAFNDPQHRYNSSTSDTEERIIDTRDPSQANKKIFKKNEGEYVDFKEE